MYRALKTADAYRDRARELRALAATTRDPNSRCRFFEIAKDIEEMARFVETKCRPN